MRSNPTISAKMIAAEIGMKPIDTSGGELKIIVGEHNASITFTFMEGYGGNGRIIKTFQQCKTQLADAGIATFEQF